MGNILIIDDDTAYTTHLAEYIATTYPLLTVETCNDSIEALAHIKNGTYDLLLIDLEMPSLDGLKLLSFARDAGIDKSRLVLLSARDAEVLHTLCPMGTCLAVLNKHEICQQSVLEMILSSLNKKAQQR